MDHINKIICGNALTILKTLPNESINCCVTSPPYWGLRDYGIEPVVWGGDEDCKHDFGEYDSKLLHENRQNLDGGTLGNPEYRENLHGFGNAKAGFCSKCGAWRGSLGLEPTFELYIKHLCDIFDEIKRVLRKDGTCFVNLGDSYFGGGDHNEVSYDKNDKVIEGSLNYDYLCENLCDGCRKAYQIGKSHNENLPVPKQVVLSSLPNRESKEVENDHFPTLDSFQQGYHTPISNLDSKHSLNHESEQVLSSQESKHFSSSPESKKNDANQPHDVECLCCGRSFVSYVQESEYKGHNKKNKPLPLSSSDSHIYKNHNVYPYLNYTIPSQKVQDKSLCLIPQRFAIEMVNRGWILRNTLIWHKPNCMPSSAKDRFTVDFEYVYFFVKNKKYWFEQQFEKYDKPLNRWGGPEIRKSSHKYIEIGEPKLGKFGATSMFRKGRPVRPVDSGRNKRAVWTIPTKPFPEAHFAVYPERLIEPMVKAGCPKGGVVLDPFMGAGTTAVVAKKQGKKYIGIELKQEYIDMANKRIKKIPETLF